MTQSFAKTKNTYSVGICFSLSNVNHFFRQPWILFVSLANKTCLVDTNEHNNQKWWWGFGDVGLVFMRNQLKLYGEFTVKVDISERKQSQFELDMVYTQGSGYYKMKTPTQVR